MHEYNIRNGVREDSNNIAETFMMAGGEAIRWIFGKNAAEILIDLANLKFSPFSWSRSIIMEVDGEFAGAIVTYPMDVESELNSGLDRVWQKHYNLITLPKFIFRVRKWEKYTPKPKDSHYIHTLAVFDKFRGHGIAGRLLGQVQKIARAGGQSAIALEVISDNEPAIRAYEKFGFKYSYEIPLSKFSLDFQDDDRVIFAMTKEII